MKTKTFSNTILSVFALVFLMSFASAATLAEWNLTSDGNAINVDSNVNAGTFSSTGVTFNAFGTNGANAEDWSTTSSVDTSKYFEVTISPQSGSSITIADIDFDYSASIIGPASFELQYSKQSGFASPISVVTKNDVSSTIGNSQNSGLSISVASGETLTLRWYGYDFSAATNEFHIKNLKMEGTTTQPVTSIPEDVQECTTTGNPSQLEIKNIDFSVTEGFGDDNDYWYPFDEIEVEFDVQNDGSWDVDDLEIKVCLYDTSAEECVMDEDDMDINDNKFNLDWDDDDEQTVILTFDVDPDKLNEGNTDYEFYIIVEGTIDDNDAGSLDNQDVCVSDSENIEIRTDETFIILNNFNHPETVTCGEDVLVSFDVWNIGDQKIDKEDIFIQVFNQELKLEKTIEMDSDVRALDSERVEFSFKFPEDADEKWYTFDLSVFDNDDMDSGDIYENSENDEAEYETSIKVEGCSSSQASALVSASLVSGGKAGEELEIKATVTNTGDKSAVFTINPSDYNAWASLTSIDKTSLNLASGASGDVTIKFAVDEDASGDNTFSIEILSDGKSVIKQPVSVSIEDGSGFGITGSSIFSGDNTYLWIIGGLNVLLVVIIIIVAISVAKK